MTLIRNAKVIGSDTDPLTYHHQPGKRGERSFVMSRSELLEFAKCPMKWMYGGNEDEEIDSTTFGTLVDILLTQPGRFEDAIAVKPDTYASDEGEKPWNGNSKVCKAWLKEHEKCLVVSRKEHSDAGLAVARLQSDPAISGFLKGCQCAVMVTADYHDADTGLIVPLKCLIDIVPQHEKSLADLKTTRNAGHRKWQRDVFDNGYACQAALYLDCYVAATGEDRVDFRHVLVENVFPFQVGRRILTEDFLNVGRAQYLSALRLYAKCVNEQQFPGYDDNRTDGYNGWTFVHPEPYMLAQ